MSGEKIGTPDCLRRTIASTVSVMGTASATKGTIRTAAAAVFIDPMTDTAAITYPRNMDPVSPMKILAGLKLYCRKPRHAPVMATIAAADTHCPIWNARRAMAIDAIVAIPAASPSRPSIRLTVLINPMIQKIVSGMEIKRGNSIIPT